MVDVDARAFPSKPKSQPAGSPQSSGSPKENPQPAEQSSGQRTSQASQANEGQRKEEDVSDINHRERLDADGIQLISVDLDGVKGDSRAHGQLVDLDARGAPTPKQKPKKQSNVSLSR